MEQFLFAVSTIGKNNMKWAQGTKAKNSKSNKEDSCFNVLKN